MRLRALPTRPSVLLIGAAIVLALLTDIASAIDDDKSAAALVAAEKWLALVDTGNYGASWKEASDVFKAGISRETWVQTLHSDREPEGRIISRKIAGRRFEPSPPDNRSVMIWYDTSFQNRQRAVERLWTRLDKDDQWRVTGYVITAASPDRRSMLMALLLMLIIIAVWFMELKLKRDAAEQ